MNKPFYFTRIKPKVSDLNKLIIESIIAHRYDVAMNDSHPQLSCKPNRLITLLLSLIIVISGSLLVVHDQLVDHHHSIECPFFALNGSSALPGTTALSTCTKQIIEEQSYRPIALVLPQLEKLQARAPPTYV